MWPSAIWLAGLALEAALIVRAVQGRFLGRYFFFYSYLASVLLTSASLVPVYRWWPQAYGPAYWYSQFLVLVVGCGVVWEIYRTALACYPGAARMARNVLPFFFVLSFSRVFVKAWNSHKWLPGATSVETERDLRIVQAALLASLIALLAYYSVPIGRNLKGMMLGYGFFLGTSIIHLTARDYLGATFQHAWAYIQPLAYLVVLSVWLAGLWVYAPAPELQPESRLEANYQALVAGTRRQLSAARTHLVRTMRP
jgi:hypothetical protein